MFEISFFFNPSIYDKRFKRVWELDQNISSLFLYLFSLSRESFNHLCFFQVWVLSVWCLASLAVLLPWHVLAAPSSRGVFEMNHCQHLPTRHRFFTLSLPVCSCFLLLSRSSSFSSLSLLPEAGHTLRVTVCGCVYHRTITHRLPHVHMSVVPTVWSSRIAAEYPAQDLPAGMCRRDCVPAT